MAIEERGQENNNSLHWMRRLIKSDAFLISVAMVVLAIILVSVV
jgi:hypothetical protein